MDNIQELREIVNPVFNTAKSCLNLNAIAGDADSQRLQAFLGFNAFSNDNMRKYVTPEIQAQVQKLVPVFMIYTWSRFHGMNRLIESEADSAVVDLPCGYTARGMKMARMGRSYYGFDLPAVIDVIGPAVEQLQGKNANIHYDAVDATNFDSLAAPLAGEARRLMIVTEGLLMYFNQPELETVFTNVRRLLQKHGGSWVIVDRAYYLHERDIASAVLDHDPAMLALHKAVISQGADNMADTATNQNILFQGDDEAARAFIGKMGFEIREICMEDYLPDHFDALKGRPQAEAEVRNVFRSMYFWVLTAKTEAGENDVPNLPFAVESEYQNGTFSVRIQGRMDTITAPELLKRFQAVTDKIEAIEVDVADMAYVSSAGLRVLLMMYKSLDDKNGFKLLNVKDEVREILEVTGFDQLLM